VPFLDSLLTHIVKSILLCYTKQSCSIDGFVKTSFFIHLYVIFFVPNQRFLRLMLLHNNLNFGFICHAAENALI
jgi:hypothetical protein